MSFHVGQKVVCVDASANKHSGIVPPLVKNETYTVSEVRQEWDGLGVDLVESPAPDTKGRHTIYSGKRFRAAQARSTETGMAILRKVADNAAKRRELIGLD